MRSYNLSDTVERSFVVFEDTVTPDIWRKFILPSRYQNREKFKSRSSLCLGKWWDQSSAAEGSEGAGMMIKALK